MESYALNNYYPATIKSYVISLNKVPVIGISLGNGHGMTSVEEFVAVYESIVNADGFGENNRNDNDGPISTIPSVYNIFAFIEKKAAQGSDKIVYFPEWFSDVRLG